VKRLPPPAARASAAPEPARDSLAQLLQILQDEGRALAGGDVEALARAVLHKEATLRQLVSELGRVDGAALRNAVRQARDLNERNARLLAPRLNINRARLETLFGGGRTDALYLADGRAAQPQHRSPQRGVRA